MVVSAKLLTLPPGIVSIIAVRGFKPTAPGQGHDEGSRPGEDLTSAIPHFEHESVGCRTRTPSELAGTVTQLFETAPLSRASILRQNATAVPMDEDVEF